MSRKDFKKPYGQPDKPIFHNSNQKHQKPPEYKKTDGVEKIILKAKAYKETELSLSGMKLSILPEQIIALKDLKVLDLSYNNLEYFPNALLKMPNLKQLYLNNNQIKNIPEEIIQLKKLSELNLRNNNIKVLPNRIGELKYLEALNLGQNEIDELPEGLKKIKTLIFLDISENNFQRLPQWLFENKNLLLEQIDFSANLDYGLSRVAVTPAGILYLPLVKTVKRHWAGGLKKGLSIEENPLEDPPLEVVYQGKASILEYFRRKEEQGLDYLKEAKIVVVGAGGAGKTTLVKKLLNPAHPVPNEDDKRTEGVGVTDYSFKCIIKSENIDVTAHIWDFGGQEIYHSTHQFFLSEDTLYLLLNDNRKNETDFYYWLNIVALRAGDQCPILVVFNEKDNVIRRITLNEEHFEVFPGLVKIPIDVNFADKNLARFQVMVDAIHDHFTSLEALGKALPKFWVAVRNELQKLEQDYILLDTFMKICQSNGIPDEEQARIVSQTLHNLGALLHFQGELGLDDLIVLNPNWCLDAVYRALDAQVVKENHGKFKMEHLIQIWSEPKYKGKQLELLNLMHKFGLCYEVQLGKEYIAPQLLPLTERRYPDFPVNQILRYRYTYKFMPKGIITRFIARMSKHLHEPYVWYSGVTLNWGETIAEVSENPIAGEINIRLYGPEKKRRLLEIQDTLLEIQQAFRGLKVSEKIPCNCDRCSTINDPFLFDVEELIALSEANFPAICHKEKPVKPVSAKQLLDGVFDTVETVIRDIKKLMAAGETGKAIEQLPRVRQLRNEGILISMRFLKLESDQLKGVVSDENYRIELSKVNEALSTVVNRKYIEE